MAWGLVEAVGLVRRLRVKLQWCESWIGFREEGARGEVGREWEWR